MNARALKNRLPRTWGAFFGRYGNFTPVQLAAIPPLLEGANVLIHAGTASGKTEAALAPLVERHLLPVRPIPRLSLLYLLPARALINDLYTRLTPALETLQLRAAVKSHDLDTFDPRRPADVLLTTPESLDSLMASQVKTLIHLRAVVIDELHAFDGSLRGDHLRALLSRLRALRAFAAAQGDADAGAIQCAALSATLAQPEASAGRYLPEPVVISAPGGRAIQAEGIPLEADYPRALLECLDGFRERGWKKAIVFCNTRAEVEYYAAQVRAAKSPFGSAVYVHYSNLERARRQAVESQFAGAEAALCFASSTLELGIDIGSVDAVLLIGAPPNRASFTQRVGRAGRRSAVTNTLCFYRTPLERALFEALLQPGESGSAEAPFRPSVAVQQVFSLIKQSPTGGIRLNPTATLLDGLLPVGDLEAILGQLQASGYLQTGRPGEWRAGPRLNQLIDLQSAERVPLSLFSNLQINNDTVKIRDQLTQQVIANVDRYQFEWDTLLLEGRPLNIEWIENDSLWVTTARGSEDVRRLPQRASRPLLAFELAGRLPTTLGLSPGAAPAVAVEADWLWFHWLGDLYGQVLAELLGYTVAVQLGDSPGLCLLLADEPRALHRWTAAEVRRHLRDGYRRYEGMLALGAYHHLLPTTLRRRAVVEQFGVERFLTSVQALQPSRADESMAAALLELVAADAG